MDSTARPRESLPPQPARRHHALVLLAYVVLAGGMTWPLLPSSSSHVPLGTNDIWQFYWNTWWWKTALLERGQSPYHTDMIFRPIFREEPAPLGCHTHSPANMLQSLPIAAAAGIPAALDLSIFAGFVLAGFGLYLLAREYVPGMWAPFLGGIVFAYFPQHVEQSLEHLNLASIQGMPLFLWALVRVVRRRGWIWPPVCGALFAYNSLLSWHNGLLVIPAGIAVLLFEFCRACGAGRPRPPLLAVAGRVVAATAVAALLVAPFLAPLVETVASGAASYHKRPVNKPIDVLFLLIPHSGHPLWGSALADLYRRFRSYQSVGFVAYLGVAAIALAALAPLVDRVRAPAERAGGNDSGGGVPEDAPCPRGAGWVWFGILVFSLLLSFGDELRVAGYDTGVPMPFRWLREVPIFGIVRVANRFLVPAMLGLAMLAALGASVLATFAPSRRRRLLLGGVTVLLLLDLAWVPYPVREVPAPPWIGAVAKTDADLTVLDIPSGYAARAAQDMFLQTLHRHPIASGYTAAPLRRVTDMIERFPVLRRVFEAHPGERAQGGPTMSETIRALEIDIVVLHLDRAVSRIRARRERLRERFPDDLYRIRMENPEVGTPGATLRRVREELRSEFGEPAATFGEDTEIYLTSPRAQLRTRRRN